MTPGEAPPLTAFNARERRLIRRLRTPAAVQRWLNALPYNTEPAPFGATLRSFRGVVERGTACFPRHAIEKLCMGQKNTPLTQRFARLPEKFAVRRALGTQKREQRRQNFRNSSS